MSASIHVAVENRTCKSGDTDCLKRVLFDRLCPLLIIKMLPLRVFDDFNSMTMYGQLLKKRVASGKFSCFSVLDNKKGS